MAANSISLTTYSGYDGLAGSTASTLYVMAHNIQDFQAKTNPASGSIATLVKVLYHDGASTRLGELWVSNTAANINTALNASTTPA